MKMFCFHNPELSLAFLHLLSKCLCGQCKIGVVSPCWAQTRRLLNKTAEFHDASFEDTHHFYVSTNDVTIVGVTLGTDGNKLRGIGLDIIVVNCAGMVCRDTLNELALIGGCEHRPMLNSRNQFLSFLSKQNKSLVIQDDKESMDSVAWCQGYMG